MLCEPIVGERFFGREEVLELLNKRVSALKDGYRQNIAFTGQSLAGKTSILHHFLYTIKDEEFIAIYIEIIKEPFRTFANRFIATLLHSTLLKLGERADLKMEPLVERAQKVLPKTCLEIKHINACVDKGEIDEAYSSLLGLTSAIKEEVKMPCIVILDEFDNLEHMGVRNPFLNFGKVIMLQKDTMYIVTSSRNQAIKKILSEKLSLLFGNFEIVKIAGFSLKTASDFINIRLAGYEIDDIFKRFLMAFSEGNPFYLHQLTGSIKDIASARMSNYVDRDVVARAILEQVYDSKGLIYQYLMNFIFELIDSKYRDLYTQVMVSIAGGCNKQQDISRTLKAKSAEVSKALIRMVELGFLSKNGIFYKIDDVLLEFWVTQVYQKKREMLVDDIFNNMRHFEEEISLYISAFCDELNKPVIARITELLNSFSNELVPIDAKYIRLPHFTKIEIKTFQDFENFISATLRGKAWVVKAYEHEVDDNDIIDYMRGAKALGCKISNKIIISLKGIDENANLLAKELKISIWNMSTVNMLFNLYGKKRLVLL